MSNFVTDASSLPFPKTDLNPLPSGADPTKFCQAVDWNAVCKACTDIRTYLLDTSATVPVARAITAGTGLSGGGSLAADRSFALANTAVSPGSYTYSSLTVDAQGRLTAASSGAAPAPATRNLTAGTGLTGGGDLSADRSFALANTAVSPGSYTTANITVDAQGRLTAASTGSSGVPTSRNLTAGTGLSGGGDLSADRSFALANTAVAPGSYTYSSLTVDAQGRLTAASSGTTPVLPTRLVSTGTGLTGGGDLSTDRTHSVATNGITNALLAQMATLTVKGNSTGGTANASDLDMPTLASMVQSALAAVMYLGAGNFGSGLDGAATFDGSTAVTGCTRSGSAYTATQDLFFTTATFSAGVTLDMTNAGANAGFRFYAQSVVVLSGTATITWNGIAASSFTAGAGLGASPLGGSSGAGSSGVQNAGQVGGNAGNWATRCAGGNGGASGAAAINAGAAGGTANTTFTESTGAANTWDQLKIGKLGLSTAGPLSGGAGGASGGGTTGVAKGGGGGGGGGVGVAGIRKMSATGTLALTAKGGVGGDGEAQTGSQAGGGGGGGGGIMSLGYGGATIPGNITTSAAGGAGGNPQGTGHAGSSGSAGTVSTFALGSS